MCDGRKGDAKKMNTRSYDFSTAPIFRRVCLLVVASVANVKSKREKTSSFAAAAVAVNAFKTCQEMCK